MDRSLFDGVEVLSFDCYGTLIDWETGIADALAPWLARHGHTVERDRLLERYGAAESAEEQRDGSRLYPEILRAVHRRLGAELGLDVTDEEAAAFSRSVPDWPAFDDSPEALRYLKQHLRRAILFNVDRASR